MKLSARRKVIIPLLFLVLIPVIFVSFFFYTNQEKHLIETKIRMAEVRIDDMVTMIQKHENTLESKVLILDYIKTLDIQGGFVLEDETVIYANVGAFDIAPQDIVKYIDQEQDLEGTRLVYKAFNQWNWKIGIVTDTDIAVGEIIDLDWIILGTGLIFLLFTFEAILLITDSFFRPVKILLNGYNDIISGNYQSEIQLETEGEMGMLGMAFNDMRKTIAHRTNKAIQMRNMTDDILRSISTGIITTDVEGHIVKYNGAARKMIGLGESAQDSEAFNMQVIKVLVAQIQRTLHTEEEINEVVHFQESSKSEMVYYDITTTIMYGLDGVLKGVICSFNDISQRKRVEERIVRLDRMASLGQLSAGLAHEIRNPLSGMKMATQVLYSRLGRHLGEAEDKMFAANMKEIDRLNNLITELLEFSKPKTPHIRAVDPFEAIVHTLHFSKRKISDKAIEVVFDKPEDTVKVLFDEAQLSQVFLNIISNAVDAMDKKGLLTIGHRTVRDEGSGQLEIFLSDNGCGIDDQYISSVFDPFYTTKASGTGLGLAVVHRLVTANNGDISVSSTLGIGTTFTLRMQLDEG